MPKHVRPQTPHRHGNRKHQRKGQVPEQSPAFDGQAPLHNYYVAGKLPGLTTAIHRDQNERSQDNHSRHNMAR